MNLGAPVPAVRRHFVRNSERGTPKIRKGTGSPPAPGTVPILRARPEVSLCSRPRDLSSGRVSWRSVVPWRSGPLRFGLRPLRSGPGPTPLRPGPGLLLSRPGLHLLDSALLRPGPGLLLPGPRLLPARPQLFLLRSRRRRARLPLPALEFRLQFVGTTQHQMKRERRFRSHRKRAPYSLAGRGLPGTMPTAAATTPASGS